MAIHEDLSKYGIEESPDDRRERLKKERRMRRHKTARAPGDIPGQKLYDALDRVVPGGDDATSDRDRLPDVTGVPKTPTNVAIGLEIGAAVLFTVHGIGLLGLILAWNAKRLAKRAETPNRAVIVVTKFLAAFAAIKLAFNIWFILFSLFLSPYFF